MLAHSLLKMSGKSWYFLGTELRSMDASENAEWAFMVTSERASWKTSVLSILWMQENVATLMRAIFRALSFRVTSQGSDISVASEVEACKGRDISDELGAEEFTLGIDPKSLHAMVLMQMVCNVVVQHSRGFLKHVVISVTERVKITAA